MDRKLGQLARANYASRKIRCFVLKYALTLLFCLFIAFLPSLVFILTFEMHYFTKRVLKTVGASQVQSVMIEILTIIGQSAIFS